MLNQAATATGPTVTSDYLAISRKIAEFSEVHSKNYSECVKGLLKTMETYFPALMHKTNPIVLNLPYWNAGDMEFVIVEYSGWTNDAIHLFLDSRIRMRWSSVVREIERNVGEELGDLTHGIPHLEMMRQGHRLDLNIETDNVTYSDVTERFIRNMRRIFKHEDNAFACGALLGLEATATEEFKVVDRFLRWRKTLIGGELERGSITDLYIGGHVDHYDEDNHPEDSHYLGLEKAIGEHINPKNIHRFIKGFFEVCLNLNTWWELLTVETYYQGMRRTDLTVTDSEVADISPFFQ